ncbi:Nck-associated protein 5 [Acipenser ruthenus]|uniref:Nck-associated protein 5 n=1 Tax=Acipenser ruthenus TaxID=7906 RepID=A0A444U6J0_ACIRT|nr:Nck-associated protein 5 [Acipenser ruthenus]
MLLVYITKTAEGKLSGSKGPAKQREKLIHELEEERRLRLESEKRLGEVTVESEQSTAHMLSLQQQLSSMVNRNPDNKKLHLRVLLNSHRQQSAISTHHKVGRQGW